MDIVKFGLALLVPNMLLWVYAVWGPQSAALMARVGVSIADSIWWPPVVFFPLIFWVNVLYGYAFRVAPKFGLSVLSVGVLMLLFNVVVFALGEWGLAKRLSWGDVLLVVCVMVGLVGKFYLEGRG